MKEYKHCLQISALDWSRDICVSKLSKICKWHNWWCHTQPNIIWGTSRKLSWLICITDHWNMAGFKGNTPTAIKILFPWQLTCFQSPPTLFQYFGDTWLCHKLKLTYSCWIMHTRYYQQITKWNAKGGWKAT